MAKKTSKSKKRSVGPSLEERQLRTERQILQRALKHQRQVRLLARQVEKETAAAKLSLRNLARWIIDRELPAEREELQTATAGR